MSVRVCVFAGAIALMAVTGFAGATARAQTDQQLDWCNGKNNATPDLRIGGCTAVIQAGKHTRKNLVGAFNNRGNAYGRKGQTDRAIQDYDQAIKLDPKNAIAFNNRGSAYGSKGQYDRAIQDLDQALRLDPDDAKAFHNRGNAYYFKGQTDRAIQDYDQAIRLDPNYAKAFYYRSLAKEKKGDKAGAAADVAAARKINPNIGR